MMHLSAIFLLSFSLVASVSATPFDRRGQSFSGQATYFGTGLGACGKTNSPSDFIVALNSAQYGSGGYCFKNIVISHGGTTQQAQITDECPTCAYGSLDMSQGLFTSFAPTSVGVFPIQWWFADSAPSSPTYTSQSHTTWSPPPTTTQSTTTKSTPTSTTTSTTSTQRTTTTTSTTSTTSTTTRQTSTTWHDKIRPSSSTTSTSSTTSVPTSTPSNTPDPNPEDGNIQVVYSAFLALGNLVGVAAGQI